MPLIASTENKAHARLINKWGYWFCTENIQSVRLQADLSGHQVHGLAAPTLL